MSLLPLVLTVVLILFTLEHLNRQWEWVCSSRYSRTSGTHLGFLDHFDRAHNADLQSWTPWLQGDALLVMCKIISKNVVKFWSVARIRNRSCDSKPVERDLNQLFARFAKTHTKKDCSGAGLVNPSCQSIGDRLDRFVMERTLTAANGCLTFGVHLNGFVRTQAGIELWVAKRS